MSLSKSRLSLAPDIIVQANKLRPSQRRFFQIISISYNSFSGFVLDSQSIGFTQSTDLLIPQKKMLQNCSTGEAGKVNICDMLE